MNKKLKMAPQNSLSAVHPYITSFVLQVTQHQPCLTFYDNPDLYDQLTARQKYFNKQFRFSKKNIFKIKQVNDLLSQKSKAAYAQAEGLERYLLQQMQEPGSFISDYEIEFCVSLWSPRKYVHIEELESNPFFEYKPFIFNFRKRNDNLKKIEEHKHWMFEENHYDYPVELESFSHSCLLHDLYDHTWLSWQDIADIEEVRVEIVVRVQNF